MPSPRFPATATLLDAKICPPDKFDPLFAKITQERRVLDGYFMQSHAEETWFLFVVNGALYGAGRLAADAFTFGEIHEFFAAYSRQPQSPLSFYAADKRLLLGLMVLFRHRPALQFTTDLVDMNEVLKKLTARGADAIVGIRAGDEWAITICTKGKPVANYFPPSGAEASTERGVSSAGTSGEAGGADATKTSASFCERSGFTACSSSRRGPASAATRVATVRKTWLRCPRVSGVTSDASPARFTRVSSYTSTVTPPGGRVNTYTRSCSLGVGSLSASAPEGGK